jgi:trans-aconitate methyltransferase
MKDLHDYRESVEFYEARYEGGYMEEWDETKKNKVREILKHLPLPATGKVLDFGCGNGVFTAILKECLPSWDVYGVEISKIAVANASKKLPSCIFFVAEDSDKYSHQFDFLFSHHVIEHVPDLNETFQIIDNYLKPQAFQLHVLPCRNEGSLEFTIAQLKRNGIEKNKGNRFFFEEEGHLRRLNSTEFEMWENKIGFHLEQEFYSNQYDGAVNWITKSSPRFVKRLTAGEDAVDEEARKKLSKLRKTLLPLTYSQFLYSKYWQIKSKWHKTAKDYLALTVLFAPAMISKVFFDKMEKKSAEEWQKRKHEKNGSEMFLFFKR